jgi:hypothetical protein
MVQRIHKDSYRAWTCTSQRCSLSVEEQQATSILLRWQHCSLCQASTHSRSWQLWMQAITPVWDSIAWRTIHLLWYTNTPRQINWVNLAIAASVHQQALHQISVAKAIHSTSCDSASPWGTTCFRRAKEQSQSEQIHTTSYMITLWYWSYCIMVLLFVWTSFKSPNISTDSADKRLGKVCGWMPELTICTQVVRDSSQAAVWAHLPCTSWETVLLAQMASFQFLKYSWCARDGSLAGSLLT